MKCPKCHSKQEDNQTIVLETRQFFLESDPAFYWNFRRRKCTVCGFRFSTHEVFADDRQVPIRLKKVS
jgi:transcriptional regulator NrdR family protein